MVPLPVTVMVWGQVQVVVLYALYAFVVIAGYIAVYIASPKE
jgi:hypothetical protein